LPPCPGGPGGPLGSRAQAPLPVQPRRWRCIGDVSGFALLTAGGAHQPLPLVPRLDTDILMYVCGAFGLSMDQVAFAYDPSGQPVCDEGLFLEYCSIPKVAQLPTPQNAATFWCAELATAVAHLATGRQVSPQLFRVQAEVMAVTIPNLLLGSGATQGSAAATGAAPDHAQAARRRNRRKPGV